jgi:hypothetical protein
MLLTEVKRCQLPLALSPNSLAFDEEIWMVIPQLPLSTPYTIPHQIYSFCIETLFFP